MFWRAGRSMDTQAPRRPVHRLTAALGVQFQFVAIVVILSRVPLSGNSVIPSVKQICVQCAGIAAVTGATVHRLLKAGHCAGLS